MLVESGDMQKKHEAVVPADELALNDSPEFIVADEILRNWQGRKREGEKMGRQEREGRSLLR